MGKLNCWEFKNCGRQPGGEKTYGSGVCAAATTSIMDGIHGGTSAGRACWVISGAKCGPKNTGSGEKLRLACISCDFYLDVKNQEGSGLLRPEELHNLIK